MSETEYNNMFNYIWSIWGIWFGGGILEARGYDELAVGKDMGALEPREIGKVCLEEPYYYGLRKTHSGFADRFGEL
jgi:hypothetical protein